VETLLQMERDVRTHLAHALELQLELDLLKTGTSSTSPVSVRRDGGRPRDSVALRAKPHRA
jgi:hypothetical protein